MENALNVIGEERRTVRIAEPISGQTESSVGRRFHDSFELRAQGWNVVSDNGPDEFEVDPEVFVNYNVAEGDDLRPGNLGVRLTNRV
jgi:hypothetical protein